MDNYRVDYTGDGIFDLQVTLHEEITSTQISDPTLYNLDENLYGGSEGHFYLAQTKKEFMEISEDTDGDGQFDLRSEFFLSQSTMALPEYREKSILNGKLINFVELLTHEPVAGVKYSVDANGDGLWEETITRTDRWANSEAILDEAYEHWIYESYTYTYEDFLEQDNMLLEPVNFTLCGPDYFNLSADGLLQFSEDGDILYDRPLISGEFIMEYDVKVPIDPRYNRTIDRSTWAENIYPELLCDPHGVIAWRDGNDDGIFETAFIFTEQSWAEDQMAIAIYYSRDGSEQVHYNTFDYEASGDSLLPLYWMSNVHNFSTLTGIAWEDSKEAYRDQMKGFIDGQGNSMTASYYLDMVHSASLMGTMAASGIGGPVGFLLVMGGYTTYQYWVRPQLVDWMAERHMWGMQEAPQEYGREEEEKLTLSTAFIEFLEEASQFGIHEDPRYYIQSIPIKESNPWWDDTLWQEPEEPTFSESDVSLYYKIPDMQISPSTWAGIISWWKSWYHKYWEEGMALIPTLPDVPEWFDLDKLNAFAKDYQYENTPSDYKLNAGNSAFAYNPFGVYTFFDFTGEIGTHLYENFWHGFGSEEETFLEQDQFGLLTRTLADNHPVYTNVSFYVDAGGRPLYTPCVSSQRNLSDPIDRIIDYMELAFYSQYAGSYEEAREKDPWIVASQVIMQMVQVAVGILASNFAAFAKSPENFYFNYLQKGGKGGFLLDMGKEILEELVLEEVISTVFTNMGVSAPLANLIGEATGSFDAVSNIGDKISQNDYADLYSFLQTHTPSSTAQHLPTSAQLSVKDFKKLKQVRQVAQLKATLQARSSIHALKQLRGNVDLMHTLQTFIAKKMDMNIHLKPYLRNLAAMPIEKFTNHHMTEDAFRREVEETIWVCTVSGMSVKEFLSDPVLLEKWGLTECGNEVFFQTVLKGFGTVQYKSDGLVYEEIDGVWRSRMKYPDETLGSFLSRVDGVAFIDPPTNGLLFKDTYFSKGNWKMETLFKKIKILKESDPSMRISDANIEYLIKEAVDLYPNQALILLGLLFSKYQIKQWYMKYSIDQSPFARWSSRRGFIDERLLRFEFDSLFDASDPLYFKKVQSILNPIVKSAQSIQTAHSIQTVQSKLPLLRTLDSGLYSDQYIDNYIEMIIDDLVFDKVKHLPTAYVKTLYDEYIHGLGLDLYISFEDWLDQRSIATTKGSLNPWFIRKDDGVRYDIIGPDGYPIKVENGVDSIPESYIVASAYKALDINDGNGGFFSRIVGSEILANGPYPFTNSRLSVYLKAPFYKTRTPKAVKLGSSPSIIEIKVRDLDSFQYFGIDVKLSDMRTVPLDSAGNWLDLRPMAYGSILPLHKQGHARMDVAMALANPNDAWGFCFEHLGYTMINPRDNTNYGVKKDVLCPRWIAAGGIPIYTADNLQYEYYRNRDPNHPLVQKFQRIFNAKVPFVVQNIGTQAPLLDMTPMHDQKTMFLNALDLASKRKVGSQNMLFEDLMLDLNFHHDTYGLSKEEAIELQEDFGLLVNHVTGQVLGFNPTYDMWWGNVRAKKVTSGLMYIMLTKSLPSGLTLDRYI